MIKTTRNYVPDLLFSKLYSIMIDNNVSVHIVDGNVTLRLDHNF